MSVQGFKVAAPGGRATSSGRLAKRVGALVVGDPPKHHTWCVGAGGKCFDGTKPRARAVRLREVERDPIVVEAPSADAFCRATYPRLAATLGLHCGEPALGEELAQEALVRALERWASVSELRSPEAWVYRVAFNLEVSAFRRRAAERRAAATVARRDGPERSDLADVLTIRHALAALPPRQRAAVVLRHLSDLPVAAVADILGCAEGTVKALTSQGLDALRRQLRVREGADHA